MYSKPGILIHPKRTNSSKEYDIAIIILEKKPPYSGEFVALKFWANFYHLSFR